MTVHLQRAPTGHRMVREPRPDKSNALFCPCASSATQPVSVRRQLPVQPVSTPPLPHGHLQPCQLESPSHTANANGRRAAVGAHGVT